MPCRVILLTRGIKIIAAEGQTSTLLDGCDLDTPIHGKEQNPPFSLAVAPRPHQFHCCLHALTPSSFTRAPWWHRLGMLCWSCDSPRAWRSSTCPILSASFASQLCRLSAADVACVLWVIEFCPCRNTLSLALSMYACSVSMKLVNANLSEWHVFPSNFCMCMDQGNWSLDGPGINILYWSLFGQRY